MTKDIKNLYLKKILELSQLQKIIGNFPTNTETQTVEVKTLDSFDLKNVNFIKIDVQGYEFEVLEGGEKLF